MISSTGNPAVRRASRLRKARGREREGAFFVEGRRAVAVALETRWPVRRVFHTRAGARRLGELLKDAERLGIPLSEVSVGVMGFLTSTATAPDVLAEAVLRERPVTPRALDGGAVLAGVHDPATAGSVMASVAAFGGQAVAFAEHSVDAYAPKTVRAAQGAHFLLAVARNRRAAETLAEARAAGVTPVALVEDGPAPWDVDLTEPFVLVLGPEAAPLPDEVSGAAQPVAVPAGAVTPALAPRAAVVLAEARRQRSVAG